MSLNNWDVKALKFYDFYIYSDFYYIIQRDSISAMKEELARANQVIATEQEYSKDLRLKYEVLQQKEDQNIQAIDNLQRRISLLEQKVSQTIIYIDDV